MAIHALTFVFGVWLLQQMSDLPNAWILLGISSSAVLAIFFLHRFRVIVALSVLVLGFCWAGFFVQLRLSDALPKAW